MMLSLQQRRMNEQSIHMGNDEFEQLMLGMRTIMRSRQCKSVLYRCSGVFRPDILN